MAEEGKSELNREFDVIELDLDDLEQIPKDRKRFSYIDDPEELEARIRMERIFRLTDWFYEGRLNEQEFTERVIPLTGVEVDPQGRLILYHATTAEHLVEIMKAKAIKPSAETGKRLWRTSHEESSTDENDLAKKRKVYLARNENVSKIAHDFDASSIVFILQVHVDTANLRPDEDNRTYKDKQWAESLVNGFKTASYEGTITDFSVAARTSPLLASKYAHQFLDREVKASDQDEKSKIHAEYQATLDTILARDTRNLQQVGVNVSQIPVVADLAPINRIAK